ncbi:dTMP kinase [Methanobrevibacter sp. OttesenSCG-928-K11]|nr:dTMP kinase [Methanobrevibacter sp. OttesenSCG-928-K11]MDL2270869.1 dTMP kinase [Methanobrevibacter sp. OttesenSCG-928-I08]
MYIVFEGIDGAGKTTQIDLLKNWLVDSGFEVETIVEPSDGDVGKLIRKILLEKRASNDITQKELGLLFAADRLELMDKISKLQYSNKIIISDRSFYSSLVYQKPQEWIEEINKFALIPDIVLLLDLDLKISVSRSDQRDEFENEEFLKEVKENYLELANTNPNFKIINGNNGPNKVSSDIKKAIAPLLGICKDGIR